GDGGGPPRLAKTPARGPRAALDGGRPHAKHARPAGAGGRGAAPRRITQVTRPEDVRQPVQEAPHAQPGTHGRAQRGRRDLAGTPRERHGADARRIDRRQRAGGRPASRHAGSPQTRRSTSSHRTWPARMCVSWMREESVLAETRRLTSTMPASAPPLPPVSPIVLTPSERQADTPRSTLGD